MSRWGSSLLFAFTSAILLALAAPAAEAATVIAVKVKNWNAQGQGHTAGVENTASFALVTGLDSEGEPFEVRCEGSSTGGCTIPDNPQAMSSQLFYDNTREKLVKCEGLVVDGGPCMDPDGVVNAELEVRLGKLKFIPAKDPSTPFVKFTTSESGVRLEFDTSSDDSWNVGYTTSGVNRTPDFTTVPAGGYKVYADDLARYCKPTQTNDGVTVTVPEGVSAEDGVEVTIVFAGTDCTVTVTREDQDDSGASGSVMSMPAGITCGAFPSDCVGTVPYGTELTLTPLPEAGVNATWVSSQCSVTTGDCVKDIETDRTFDLSFFTPNAPPDAGPDDPDAGNPDDPDAGGAGDPDAGAPGNPDAGGDNPGSPDGGSGGSDSDGDGGGCSIGGQGVASSFALLLLATIALASRRRRGRRGAGVA